jgi:2-methylisocitrate lyase-like PEP mutase family enzyme
MTKKNSVPIVNGLEQAVSDVANAASVAATGSEIGVLELAVEDEINPRGARQRKAVVSGTAATNSPGGRVSKRRPAARRSH